MCIMWTFNVCSHVPSKQVTTTLTVTLTICLTVHRVNSPLNSELTSGKRKRVHYACYEIVFTLTIYYVFRQRNFSSTFNLMGLVKMSSGTIGFFTINVSVRLSDRSSYREEQKNIVKYCPKLGLNPGPLDHHSKILLTVLGRYVLSRRFL